MTYFLLRFEWEDSPPPSIVLYYTKTNTKVNNYLNRSPFSMIC
ncbi:hypothetical protein [Escherichia phage dw-ec]|nr:hypothetical protein [Escherichia phage dw-ec]